MLGNYNLMVIISKDAPVITAQKPIPKKLLCLWHYVLLVLIRACWKSCLWGQGTGNREQGTGYRWQVTGATPRGQVTGYREQGTGNREQGTGNRLQVTGDREQVTGDRLQVTGYRLQVTGYRLQVLRHGDRLQNWYLLSLVWLGHASYQKSNIIPISI